MLRSIRWLDRCIPAHAKPTQQNLFAIIQGGLDPELRKTCIRGTLFYKHHPSSVHLIYLLILTITISSNVIGALAALIFTNKSIQL